MTVSDEAKGRHPSVHRLDRPLVVPARVRAWTRERGLPVGERGRVRSEVVERYRDEKRRAS